MDVFTFVRLTVRPAVVDEFTFVRLTVRPAVVDVLPLLDRHTINIINIINP